MGISIVLDYGRSLRTVSPTLGPGAPPVPSDFDGLGPRDIVHVVQKGAYSIHHDAECPSNPTILMLGLKACSCLRPT